MLTSFFSCTTRTGLYREAKKRFPSFWTIWARKSTMEDSHRHSRRSYPRPSHHPTPHQFTRHQSFPNHHLDPYFRPLGAGPNTGYHGPPPDFPPGGSRPHGRPGGPHPSPHPYPPNWAPSFGGMPPPGLQNHPSSSLPHHHTHMNFAPPDHADSRWSAAPPPFMGGMGSAGGGSGSSSNNNNQHQHQHQHRASELHSTMRFPNPPPSAFDLNHQQKHAAGSGRELYHPPFSSSGPEGSYLDQLRSKSSLGELAGTNHHHKFPLQNGVGGFQLPLQQGGGSSVLADLSAQHQRERAKKIKTMPRGMSKCHTPKRPLVEANQEVRVKHSTQLSVVCYNLLAQDLIAANMYLYTHCSAQQLDWDFRRENLLKDLTQASADILCLQEVQSDHYHRWYQPQLTKHGFTGLFKRRTGTNTDGCAIFYHESKLKLLEWKALEYQRKTKVLNRDNVAILAKFATIEKQGANHDAVFCIANTHLLFNPKAGEVKLAQMSYLLAELHKMASKPGAKPGSCDLLPVLLCGDFNSTPNSPMLKFLLGSRLDYSNLSALVVAGYFEGGTKARPIPFPLLPNDMNIGLDCVYRQQEPTKSSAGAVATTRNAADTSSKYGGESAKAVHSEFVSTDSEVDCETRPVRSARSMRGAKGKIYSSGGVKETNRVSESRRRGDPTAGYLSAEDLKAMKSTSVSGGSSVENSVLGEGEGKELSSSHSRASCAEEDSLGESMESSSTPSQAVKNRAASHLAPSGSGTDGGRLSRHKQSTGAVLEKETCPKEEKAILSHPFKLLPAYPISKKTQAATITTFHQHAFETVDYIFFSPISCRSNSNKATGGGGSNGKKKQLTGFNLLKRRVLPSTHTLLDLGPQPHQFLSSDHLMLQAVFQFSW